MEKFLIIIHYMVLGLSLAAPIGPMNIEVLNRGFKEGFLSSWLVGLGGLTGDLILLIFIFFGLQDFMQNIIIQSLMYIIGVILLSYLGVTSIYNALKKSFKQPDNARSKARNAYFSGFLISLANPISLIFWFGIYGTSLQILTSTQSISFSILCSFAILAGLFLWNLNLVLTVFFSKRIMNEKIMRVITFIAGISLLYFSVRFII
ncbi:MAG TPA: LysE family transporter, partial [Bacillales bacterium]|nr:LysE family transporter [Bacillales bacterium]